MRLFKYIRVPPEPPILPQMPLKLSSRFNAHRSETPFFSTLSNLPVDMEDFAITVQLMDKIKPLTISYISVSNIVLSNLAPEHTSFS